MRSRSACCETFPPLRRGHLNHRVHHANGQCVASQADDTFQKNYLLENLAVRPDNSVLITALNHKELSPC
jgi:hypothetical protein